MPAKPLIPSAKTQKAIAEGRASKGMTVHKFVAAWRKSIEVPASALLEQ